MRSASRRLWSQYEITQRIRQRLAADAGDEGVVFRRLQVGVDLARAQFFGCATRDDVRVLDVGRRHFGEPHRAFENLSVMGLMVSL